MDVIYQEMEDNKSIKFRPVKDQAMAAVVAINNSINALFDEMFLFVDQSDPLNLLLKVLLCGTPDGVSTFYGAEPGIAWFGNPRDPLLLEITKIIDKAEEQLGISIPWTAAVPANTFNWSSQADVSRRKMPDTFKTGKKHPHQIGQYVKYNNMRSFYNCVSPTKAGGGEWIEGEEFPGCPHFDENWTEAEAEKMGYTHPFANEWANRIEGTDGNVYGRPTLADVIQIFSYDIYRAGYMEYKSKNSDWHGVNLKRYGVRRQDMWNVTLNPSNAAYWAFGWSGVENLTVCQHLPAFVSFPHFLYADPRFADNLVGVHAVQNLHDSYVDIEPQTGMLARAMKRIQVNYQLFDTHLPESPADTLTKAANICQNITDLFEKIPDGAGLPPPPPCNATLPINLFTCLASPSSWKYNEGSVMVPMGWVQESIIMPESAATELNDLFLVDDVATQMRFWCLVIAGISAGLMIVLLWSSRDFEKRRGVDKSMYSRIDQNNANNAVSSAPLLSYQDTPKF
jgi:hypothetical protein